jgi:8-oxo-dGTP pyrophosphatase MutT (NUDIX family)
MSRLIGKVLQPYWRLTRGLTLGAQGLVIDAERRILLIRHTYRPGWFFPGGGVEPGEAAETALARELVEEAGVVMQGTPRLFGLYTNFQSFPRDHIAFYVVERWTQPSVPGPNAEIAEQQFYARSELPDDISRGAAQRIIEVFDGRAPSPIW